MKVGPYSEDSHISNTTTCFLKEISQAISLHLKLIGEYRQISYESRS